MILRMIARSLSRRVSRKLAAVLAVWIGISLTTALLTLGLDVGDKINRELSSFGANIRIEPAAAAVSFDVGDADLASGAPAVYLAEGDVAKLKTTFWRNNVLSVVPRLRGRVTVGGREASILGVWIEKRLPVEGAEPFVTGARDVYAHWRIDGAWPADPAQCLAGTELAAQLHVGVGDRLDVVGHDGAARLVVAGLVAGGDEEDRAIVTSLAAAQGLLGAAGSVSEIDVSALTTPENQLAEKYRTDPTALPPADYERWVCTPYPGSVAADLQKALPGSAARVVRRIAETQGAVFTHIETLMLLLGVVTVVACALSIAGVLASAVVARRGEMALLAALGARRADVLRLFLREAAVLGLLGGLLAAPTGLFVGSRLVTAIFDSAAEPHRVLVLVAPAIGLLIALAASAWPVSQAPRQDAADVLHGN